MSEPARKIELWDLQRIKPYALNAKKHEPKEVEKLAKAIETFGWTQPIIVDKDGVIIAGHGRRLAAIHLGRTKVPVICRDDLTKDQADALRLADNRVTGLDYDMTMIQEELKRLGDADFDLTTLGFDEKELDFSAADLGDIDINSFVDDIGAAVDQQRNDNEQKVQEVDDVAAPVGDALGFKRVTIAQSRVIRDLMSRMETVTGKTGVEALIAFVSSNIVSHG